MPTADHNKIQEKWVRRWEEAGCFKAPSWAPGRKFYTRDAAPYPNGNLHIGHLRNYVLGDIVARYKRQCGYSVLYTTNFDAFGLPNELAAIRQGLSPGQLTDDNINQMMATFRQLGISYDFSHIKKTCDPGFYRWTQWLFLHMYRAGMVYRSEKALPWCDSCKVSLAFIQIIDGQCWRCGTMIASRTMPQWSIRMSAATSALYDTLDDLPNWSARSKQILRGFIGKHDGRQVTLSIAGIAAGSGRLEVFIPQHIDDKELRYIAAAPDHRPLLDALAFGAGVDGIVGADELSHRLAALKDTASVKGVRRSDNEDETPRYGFDTGLKVYCSPVNAALPVWIVNYLSSEAGPPVRGCAPASDSGDRAFAEKFAIGELAMSDKPAEGSYESEPKTYFQIRDWVISRGRKWGTPIPFIHCEKCGPTPIPDEHLPLTHEPSRPAVCPKCDVPGEYDPDTIDCNFDDAWCFCSGPSNDPAVNPFTDEATRSWLPVDWYNSGFDVFTQAHVHRFISWYLDQHGLSPCRELIDGYHGHDLVLGAQGKISKRYENEGDLALLLEQHGADILRIAVAWAAGPGKPIRWETGLLTAARKLLRKFNQISERLVVMQESGTAGERITPRRRQRFGASLRHDVVRVSDFIENYRPHAAISLIDRRLTLYQGQLGDELAADQVSAGDAAALREWFGVIVRLIAPFAPFHAEQAWQALGRQGFASTAEWPDKSS